MILGPRSQVRAVVVVAALTIIGCSLSSLRCCRKRRVEQRKILEEAMRTWEDEGGLVVAEKDEDEYRPASV
jgi:hypothetical protein